MKILFTATGALLGFVVFYLFCCFVAWEFPVNLGELDAGFRAYIGFNWVCITILCGMMGREYGTKLWTPELASGGQRYPDKDGE